MLHNPSNVIKFSHALRASFLSHAPHNLTNANHRKMAPATAEKKKGGSLLFSFGRNKAEKAKAGEYLRLPTPAGHAAHPARTHHLRIALLFSLTLQRRSQPSPATSR